MANEEGQTSNMELKHCLQEVLLETEALDLSMHSRNSEMAPNRSGLASGSIASSMSTTMAAWNGGENLAEVRLSAFIAPSDHQLRQIKQGNLEMDDSDERRCTKRSFPNESGSDTDTPPLSNHTDTDQSTENDSGKSSVNSEDSCRYRDTVRGVWVSLDDENLWSAFARCGTEMIINRGGRRMFPHINLTIGGLDPLLLYTVILEIVPADARRYKYHNNAWVTIDMSDAGHVHQPFVHPDSPNTGAFWSENTVSFSKIRLTNNKDSRSIVDGIALLQSMHKYKAVVKVYNETEPRDGIRVFDFRETTFVAVTAYQNNQITKLKIQNNPFAKAFRDANNPSFLQARQACRRKKAKQKDMWQSTGRSMQMAVPMWRPEYQLLFDAYAWHPMFNRMAIRRQNAAMNSSNSSHTMSSSAESSSQSRSSHSEDRSGSD